MLVSRSTDRSKGPICTSTETYTTCTVQTVRTFNFFKEKHHACTLNVEPSSQNRYIELQERSHPCGLAINNALCVRPSVRSSLPPCTCNNSRTTKRILMKFGTAELFKALLSHVNFCYTRKKKQRMFYLDSVYISAHISFRTNDVDKNKMPIF